VIVWIGDRVHATADGRVDDGLSSARTVVFFLFFWCKSIKNQLQRKGTVVFFMYMYIFTSTVFLGQMNIQEFN
jgi:hypothetical protein